MEREQAAKQEKKINFVFAGFIFIMAIYYGYRMFALIPWYDELYTYYYFISRGPVYAAIHWPLPNNHVGYSVLSGILNYLGSSAIGLRGVSYIAALGNLILLYRLGRRHFSGWLAVCVPVLYASMNLVNQLAVQGRGYTLAVTCFLLALEMMEIICLKENAGKKHYIIFALSLTLGLYILPSSVYWVVPLCVTGGIYLLYRWLRESNKKNIYSKILFRLVTASVCAAVMTLFLYALIWLAIGSNLLSKDAEGAFAGMSHASIIMTAPLQSMGAGMEYMLATPYIQSVERAGYTARLGEWLLTLFQYLGNIPTIAYAIAVLLSAGIFIIGIQIKKAAKKQDNKEQFLMIFLLCTTYSIPVLLWIQCSLPYYRVFSYIGVMIACLSVWLINEISKKLPWRQTWLVCTLTILALAAGCLFSPDYLAQYSIREYSMAEALKKAHINENMNVAVTDCTSQYMIKYLYGVEYENQDIEGCDLVLLDKRMADKEFDSFEWEFYHYYNTIPWDYMNEHMIQEYENDYFLLYRKQ